MMARNASSPERTNRAGSAADHFREKKYHVAISIMHGLTLQFIPPSTHAIACSTRTNHSPRSIID
nr:hypothetical protein Q903MT_gene291 [Picea sitchensis]